MPLNNKFIFCDLSHMYFIYSRIHTFILFHVCDFFLLRIYINIYTDYVSIHLLFFTYILSNNSFIFCDLLCIYYCIYSIIHPQFFSCFVIFFLLHLYTTVYTYYISDQYFVKILTYILLHNTYIFYYLLHIYYFIYSIIHKWCYLQYTQYIPLMYFEYEI